MNTTTSTAPAVTVHTLYAGASERAPPFRVEVNQTHTHPK